MAPYYKYMSKQPLDSSFMLDLYGCLQKPCVWFAELTNTKAAVCSFPPDSTSHELVGELLQQVAAEGGSPKLQTAGKLHHKLDSHARAS
jgi:hypothetical protein